jgi:F-type H+-transporting ATPase subunit delta
VKNLVIAKRYARALFALAKDEGKIEEYGQELAAFVKLLQDVPEVADAIQNPMYPDGVRKKAFETVVEKTGLSPIMKNFVSLLAEKRRLAHLEDIEDYYSKLIDEHNNVARVQLKAAVKLDQKVLNGIGEALKKMTGKKVELEFSRDPELIGGVVAQVGDLVLDGSVKTQLSSIKETLKRGELG